MNNRSIVATLAVVVGALALLAAAIGPLTARLGLLAPGLAFRLFGLGMTLGALLALILGVVGLLRTRATSARSGRGLAWLGTGAGALLLVTLVILIGRGGDAPAIHDVSTDIDDPPTFSQSVASAEGRDNGLEYPDGGPEVPALQREAFPDIQPIRIPLGPGDAWERSRDVATELGWVITLERKGEGQLEATDTTSVFRFVDDIAIRVRGTASAASVVDLRSNSRIGRGDIGANAARIRAFRDRLLETTK